MTRGMTVFKDQEGEKNRMNLKVRLAKEYKCYNHEEEYCKCREYGYCGRNVKERKYICFTFRSTGKLPKEIPWECKCVDSFPEDVLTSVITSFVTIMFSQYYPLEEFKDFMKRWWMMIDKDLFEKKVNYFEKKYNQEHIHHIKMLGKMNNVRDIYGEYSTMNIKKAR